MSKETTLNETPKMLKIRIEELKSEINGHEINKMTFKKELRKLQRIIDARPCISEEQYLQEITRQQHINAHLLERLKDRGAEFQCNWCGGTRKRMTIWWHEDTGEVLFLHFSVCQHIPEPFRDTRGGLRGWHRIDPWQDYKKELPRLRKSYGHRVVKAPGKQTKLARRRVKSASSKHDGEK